MKQISEELLTNITKIINTKRIEKYLIHRIFTDDVDTIELYNEIVDSWTDCRNLLVKYVYSYVYKEKSFEKIVYLLDNAYKNECKYSELVV